MNDEQWTDEQWTDEQWTDEQWTDELWKINNVLRTKEKKDSFFDSGGGQYT